MKVFRGVLEINSTPDRYMEGNKKRKLVREERKR